MSWRSADAENQRTPPSVEARSQWNGDLTLMLGSVLYRGSGGDADWHSHHAIQVMVSVDEPFDVMVDGETVRGRSAVVGSGCQHRILCTSQRFALLLVEPLSALGKAVNDMSRHTPAKEVARILAPSMQMLFDDDPVLGAGVSPLERALGITTRSRDTVPSDPVSSALRYIEEHIEFTPRLTDAARAAHISPSRLTHLFTARVGIPFRRYLLWARLRRCVDLLGDGLNLTEAANAAGFSDSAHLSRVFKRQFGVRPSTLLHMRVQRSSWHIGRAST